ncbi:MAG: hypothetical protein LBV69_04425 [Bacteroidales bacterium]|jgi:hypothetical protein|nr:hypothetical protein [Bacteroidales bacterium]
MKKIFVTIIFFLIFFNKGFSQNFEEFFMQSSDYEDTSKFNINIVNNNFFKNNEYFNKFFEGYSLIGFYIKPQFIYRPIQKISISAGVDFSTNFGSNYFGKILPIFRIEYKPINNFHLIFGELYGSVNHQITDNVFFNENILLENSENGLQIIYNGNRFFTDTWLQWREFIWYDSPSQEKLLFGTSNILTAFSKEKNQLNIKFIALASHVGGQININDNPIETIINTVSGFEYYIFINKKILKTIKLSALYHTSTDASPTKKMPYIQGFGVLSSAEFSNKYLNIKFSHWYGDCYFSKYGNPIFQSISRDFSPYHEDQRAFLNLHIFLNKKIAHVMELGGGFDLYYDLYNHQPDYSFGCYIKNNLNFWFAKKNKNL